MMTDSRRTKPMPPGGRDTAIAQESVGEAVETAFDHSDVQEFDPRLIQQITENVITQLRLANLSKSASSPQRGSQSSVRTSRSAVSSFSTDADDKLPPKPFLGTEPVSTAGPRMASPSKIETTSRASSTTTDDAARPGLKSLPSESKEQTPLERIWGQLFDEKGTALPRLGQLLRGLAVHLIEDFEPKQSLVVTPEKMMEYYRLISLEKELYPWAMIFDDHESYVSRMYRDFSCQHHLIQEEDHRRPDIPGLTPVGFARWMTLMLLAHPDDEFDRLKKAIVELPIDNPDDRSERFPKDVSRRLFPTVADIRLRNKLRKSMSRHCEKAAVPLPEEVENAVASGSEPEPDLRHIHTNSSDAFRPRRATDNQVPKRMPSPQKEIHTSQDSIPTVSADGALIPDDEHLLPASKPIERERKPYSATMGGGRIYDEPAIIQPAGGRINSAYAVNGASLAADLGPDMSQSTPLPPRDPPSPTQKQASSSSTQPRQSSLPPTKAIPAGSSNGLSRSSSNASRSNKPHIHSGPASTVPSNINTYPPPPPSTAAPEIHQSQLSPNTTSGRARRSSTNRRRAPSGGQGLVRPSESMLNMQPIVSHEARPPAYVERAPGHDGYGVYDQEAAAFRPARSGTAAVRRESRERKRESFSERDRERAGGRPRNRDEDYYRDAAAYHVA